MREGRHTLFGIIFFSLAPSVGMAELFRFETGTTRPEEAFVHAFDADGANELDIAVVTPGLAHVTVLRSSAENGLGFGSPETYPLRGDSEPRCVGSVDVDGDHDLDLVVACSGACASQLAVLINNGDGTYSDRQVYLPLATGPTFLLVEDLDRDSVPDLIVCSRQNPIGQGTPEDEESDYPSSTVSVLKGTRRAQLPFQPFQELAVPGQHPSCMSLVNGTLFVSHLETNELAEIEVTSDGRLSYVTSHSVGCAPTWVATASIPIPRPPPVMGQPNLTIPPLGEIPRKAFALSANRDSHSVSLVASDQRSEHVLGSLVSCVSFVNLGGFTLDRFGFVALEYTLPGNNFFPPPRWRLWEHVGGGFFQTSAVHAGSGVDNTFGSPSSTRPHSIVVEDMNGDRLADIVVGLGRGFEIEILIGVGSTLNGISTLRSFRTDP